MIVYHSTRGYGPVNLDIAMMEGLAPDGGLYVPDYFPRLQWQDFCAYTNLADFAFHLLAPFFQGSQIDFSKAFCHTIFNFPMPLHRLTPSQYILELFHGPSLSFKDFGARFFAACLEELAHKQALTVLVATSGDTGSAVAAALHDKPSIKTLILFPDKKISSRQQAQITTWGGNVTALAVQGNFDDCQKLVKNAFSDPGIRQRYHLTTANSINIARLLPQMLFYAYTSVHLVTAHQPTVNFIVPGGNLGNVTACYWAREMGFPIGKIDIATNANTSLSNYWQSGVYSPQKTVTTLANAMDVGNPSNIERLMALYPVFDQFKQAINVQAVSDEAIRTAILHCYQQYHYVICPHTATGFARLRPSNLKDIWVVAATADPAKFEEIIEPLLNISIAMPPALLATISRKQQWQPIPAELTDVLASLASLNDNAGL